MLLSNLFKECSNNEGWQTVNDVDFKFIEREDTLEIYFMGSHQTSDWIRNFLFPAKPYKDMGIPYKVHRGFLQAWKEVEDIIIAKINEDDEEGKFKFNHIVVVGYSHGGALATFCHECVWYWRPDLRENGLEGYGFEAPRIYAGWHVKKSLKERWKNFTVIRNGSDIVTHCPPWLFRFCHVGKIIKIKGDTSLVEGHLPKFVKYHYWNCVYDGLVKFEEENNK